MLLVEAKISLDAVDRCQRNDIATTQTQRSRQIDLIATINSLEFRRGGPDAIRTST
jgi:hypothetical protein